MSDPTTTPTPRPPALPARPFIDVSATAWQAGFRCPVAMSAALWADISAIPPQLAGAQTVAGRLWDVLWIAAIAIRHTRVAHATAVTFELLLALPGRDEDAYQGRALCRLDAVGLPAILLLRADEAWADGEA